MLTMKGRSVLIAEDDSSLMRGLKDNFSARQYQVYAAMDGESALHLAMSSNPDLIVLDIMLPRLNGYEICRRIREAGLTVPIIMLTAKGQEEDIIRGLNIGADDYVCKPFSIRELLARANAFMRRNVARKEISYQFGEFTLHLDSHKLVRNSGTDAAEEIPLTPKELALLELFTSRVGRAMTRDTIINIVWHNNLLTTTRSVDRCVNTLRAKIEPDPQQPTYIKTLRDVGYRFETPPASAKGI
jgi:DNA-binding response OmpR family regulator